MMMMQKTTLEVANIAEFKDNVSLANGKHKKVVTNDQLDKSSVGVINEMDSNMVHDEKSSEGKKFLFMRQ